MTNKNLIKQILKMLGIVLGASFLGLILMWAVYLLPVEPMAKNMIASYDTIHAQELKDLDYLAEADCHNVLDTGTNLIMYQEVIYPNSDTPFENSLLVPAASIWTRPAGEWTDSLIDFATNRNYNEKNTETYARYWHGYLALLKPLFFITDLDGIYLLNTVVLSGLMIAVMVLMHKRLYYYTAAYLVMIFAMNVGGIFQSFQLSAVFYALNITMLLLLFNKNQTEERALQIFVLDGVLIAFFDFLTYPFLALAVPMLTYVLLFDKKDFWKNILEMIKVALSFLLGYAGMWGMKWVYATLFTKQDVILDAINSVLHRTGVVDHSVDEQLNYGVWESISRNMEAFGSAFNIGALSFLILFLVMTSYKNWDKIKKNWQFYVICLLMMVSPFAWLIVLNNHCSLHPHLEWRTLCVMIFAGIVFVNHLGQTEGKEETNG